MGKIVKMAYPGGGLYVVEGEVCLLITAMRRGTRWSSHSHQDDDQGTLIKGLFTLKEGLNEAKDLSYLEPSVFLAPFLEIIRSEETTGPVTSLALSAVNKMISYGLIDSDHPAIAQCVEAIADVVTHARFVGTDASGDGVVLMRILQVLRALMLSPAGDYLSNESICEIMLSCFRICFETRLSELLRKTAEHCLRDMVQHLFTRLPQFADDTRVLLNMKKMRTNGMESNRSKNRRNKSHFKQKAKQSTESIGENQLPSPTDRVRSSCLTTPVNSVGNIVDMQGSLDQGSIEKADEEKYDNKEHIKKDLNDVNEIIKHEAESDIKTENVNLKGMKESKENTNETEDKANVIIEKEEVLQKNSKCIENTEMHEHNQTKKLNLLKQGNQENLKKSMCNDKNTNLSKSPAGSVEDLSVDENISNICKASRAKEFEQVEEYVNAQGVRFMPHQQLAPYGALCVRELFRFLVSLCCPHDKQNNEVMTHLGLSLLQVALEIAADYLSNFPSLLVLVKDDLCRNLILLLGTDRLSILAADLQVSFLLFESQREHLKFQMELHMNRLMELVSSDSNRISYDQRELALDAIVRSWRIPGLPAELYLNYDCGLYSTNLYEELMKLFSKNASALMGNMQNMQFVSLDAIFTLISEMEIRCKGYKELCKPSRHSASANLPTREELLAIKANKRWLVLGTEKFNENRREGIVKLAEHGLLGGSPGNPDPEKIAKFLKENPGLDKKAIGEYISKKENKSVLNCFVHSFDLKDMRIDQALRLYLESFRLPGEAPLISLLLEKFAEHWHDSNGRPFASADAAFTLAYAVIMLNVDQHNYNVKRQNNPMTADEFKRNLKKVNGGADFDQGMLDEIYASIKGEEIVMPAEQTGLVKDNYLWKVLLRRGIGPESFYLKVGNCGEFVDKELAEQAWAPIISALCRAYDKVPDKSLQRRVAEAFHRCASISAHYGMSSDLDTLVVSLCKFTGLATGGEPDQVILHLGGSSKCQLAARTLFKITHIHGDAIRASWKNIIDCLQSLYKARLLPKSLTEGEDFISPTGKVSLLRQSTVPKPAPVDQGILSSLYSYIALDTSRISHPMETTARKRATEFVGNCYLKQIIVESKFLQVESLRSLVGALVFTNSHDEDISVFLLELLLEVTVQNRDRVTCIWPIVQAQLDGLLTTAARENHPYLLERVAVGMLRLAIRLLRGEECACTVLPPLLPLAYLPSATSTPLARQIAYGLFELLKTGAANIHSTEDWKVVFSLLECAGAGALLPKQSNTVLDEATNSRTSMLDARPISPVPEWVLASPTGTEAPLPVAADTIILDRDLQPHDPAALVKCCESLTFLIRDMAHVTPFNFELCIRCVRTFAEAVLQCSGKRNKMLGGTEESVAATYQQSPIRLLDLMLLLHTRIAQVFRWWAEEGNATENISLWPQVWRPLSQGIARLCCDARRQVRTTAITYLQSTLLAHDLAQLSAVEWSQCLEQVLFPLLAQLLGPIASNDPIGVEETRVRAAMLLSKVFLHHLNPLLTLPGFLPLWLTVLSLLRAYMHADNSELLFEAIPESLKNMLLVMSSANVLAPTSNLWAPTWRTIDAFLPTLKAELFPEPPVVSVPSCSQSPQIQHILQVISLIEQQQPCFSGSIAPLQPKAVPAESKSVIKDNTEDESLRTWKESNSQSLSLSPVEVTNLSTVTISQTSTPDAVPTFDDKESQQVITLVDQQVPNVSSTFAMLPTTQESFDICHRIIGRPSLSITESDEHLTQEKIPPLSPGLSLTLSKVPVEESNCEYMKKSIISENVGSEQVTRTNECEERRQQEQCQQTLLHSQSEQHVPYIQETAPAETLNSFPHIDTSEKYVMPEKRLGLSKKEISLAYHIV
ncbi:PREDICTED: Golgi-specific brefeldin A-resistance guanine nucleotide exchange factor 1 [Eufriesea mexicana]|uniref:Golgi-specific brefeldin A-resistance guanine nucleotide exchange factor 1 n=1 Tax=Eufriesea mexicana TaxID=516756 RepID=UPI00083C8801|nr:PREDICTED: Golgi-specific brefeldin A-resistance guanine nucleotide exchange factor 1 [Eufriesea mexicana]